MDGIKRRYRALPLFASPLEEHHHGGHQDHEAAHDPASHYGSDDGVVEGKRNGHPKSHALTTNYVHPHSGPAEHVPDFATQHDAPAFREREEASSIELFYDLFFVANLSSFTSAHPIDDNASVRSYIGFFALLWFNWLQVTLYDVRFGVDSVFERTCKALHLGIMIAFAVVGTAFDPTQTGAKYGTFRKFAIILMISKIILVVQYSYILIWVKAHPKILRPLSIHIAALGLGAVICACLIPAFQSGVDTRAYVGFYIVAVIEAVAVFGSSMEWRTVSFKHTNLNERVGLLTLIILGEGIIVLTKSMSYVTKGYNYSPAVIGQIISCVVIIYCLYMLYFDQVDAKRFGTIRQQAWALMHLPFHIALVLFLEGTSRFVTWQNGMSYADSVDADLTSRYAFYNTTDELADSIYNYTYPENDFFNTIESSSKYEAKFAKALAKLHNETDIYSEGTYQDFIDSFSSLVEPMLKYFNIKTPKKGDEFSSNSGSHTTDKNNPFTDYLTQVYHLYDLVLTYFFIAAGATLIFMAVLIVIAKRDKCKGDWAAIILRTVVGTCLACVAAVSSDPVKQENFLWSGWILPTAALAILLVVVLDGVLGYIMPAPKEVEDEHEGHGHH